MKLASQQTIYSASTYKLKLFEVERVGFRLCEGLESLGGEPSPVESASAFQVNAFYLLASATSVSPGDSLQFQDQLSLPSCFNRTQFLLSTELDTFRTTSTFCTVVTLVVIITAVKVTISAKLRKLLTEQSVTISSIQRALPNFKKLSKPNITLPKGATRSSGRPVDQMPSYACSDPADRDGGRTNFCTLLHRRKIYYHEGRLLESSRSH